VLEEEAHMPVEMTIAHRLHPLFSARRSDWCTPEALLVRIRQFAPIGLDPCSNECSIVGATTEWTLRENGLARPWAGHGLVFVNPPYSRETVTAWVAKCASEGAGTDIIGLLPARTDTRWWQRYCAPRKALAGGPGSAAVCFLRGRLRFLGAPQSATFPSALVYWGQQRVEDFIRVVEPIGQLWVAS
jgi:hypothetical protein